MRTGKRGTFPWVWCLSWLWLGCSTSVSFEAPPSQDSGTKTSVPTVPGTQDTTVEPVIVDQNLCLEQKAPAITLDYYPLFRSPHDGNNFVFFWTVCNQGHQPQPVGGTYDFVIETETVNTQSPDQPQLTAFATLHIPIPALQVCSCYVQEVGINMSVDTSVLNQASLAGLGVQLATQFPSIVVPDSQLPQSNLTFDYKASLSPPSGVVAPSSKTFTIQHR